MNDSEAKDKYIVRFHAGIVLICCTIYIGIRRDLTSTPDSLRAFLNSEIVTIALIIGLLVGVYICVQSALFLSSRLENDLALRVLQDLDNYKLKYLKTYLLLLPIIAIVEITAVLLL